MIETSETMTQNERIDVRAGRFFDGFADTFDSLYDGKRNLLWRVLDDRFRRDIAERFTRTFERLGDLHGKTVFDVGCGSGVYLREALARGATKVIGLDAAPRMLELSRERLERAGLGGAGKTELVEGIYPEVRRKADCAIVMGVMDYVPDPVGFVRALVEDVSGLACLSFPSYHFIRSPIRQVRYRLRDCPLWIYRRERVEQVIRQAGAEIVRLDKIAGAGQDFHVTIRAR